MRRSQSSRRSWPLPRPPKRDAEGWLQASAMASRPLGRRGGVARPAETRTQAPAAPAARGTGRPRPADGERARACARRTGEALSRFSCAFFRLKFGTLSGLWRHTTCETHFSALSSRQTASWSCAGPPREPAARDGDIAAHPLSLSPPALRPHVTSLPSRDDEPPRRLVCTHKHTSLRPTLDASRPRRTPPHAHLMRLAFSRACRRSRWRRPGPPAPQMLWECSGTFPGRRRRSPWRRRWRRTCSRCRA